MRKSFKLQDLDCANCAAKMENAINEIEGVNSASISFMTSKLVLDANDDQFEQIIGKAQSLISKIEPDCTIVR
ncbi:cation transporter [Eggerthellaceae bacterium 3-80]|nr:heavy-metal-associated domain-containing protein [bacterium D16-34]